jgi:hypothetical protein
VKRPVIILAAVVLIAAAVIAGVLLARRHHPAAVAARTSPQATPATRTPSAAASTPPPGPVVPRPDLSGLTWTGYHGVQLPSSPSAGPFRTARGLASGYADTPLGALLAAVNIGVRANAQWGPRIYGPTIRAQVTGPDAAALLASCQSAYRQQAAAAHITGGRALGNAYVTEEAFRYDSWSAGEATLEVVSAGPGNGGVTVRATTRIELVWQGGDWRVIAPPGGDWGAEAQQLTSLAGYTVFPGQE